MSVLTRYEDWYYANDMQGISLIDCRTLYVEYLQGR